jgi:serine/threonine-protein phosphatase 5
MERKQQAELFKTKGNEYFQSNKFNLAVEYYTKALELDPTNPVLYSNRAFAHLKMENYGSAIADATKALELDPKFIKGYYRRGSAHFALGHYEKALRDFKQVVKIAPNDKDAKEKYEKCYAIVQKARFEEAISMDHDKHSTIQSIELDNFTIEPDYKGPHLTKPITVEFVNQMMEEFRLQRKLAKKYVFSILVDIYNIFKDEPNIVEITIPENGSLVVCGDVHGQYYDLLNIFKLAGPPSETNLYLFNGDFVDRGSFSAEVILTLFAYKLLYPKHFFMARGNHESRTMNRMYGFEGEIKKKYSEQAYEVFAEIFCLLPLAHVINKKILVLHGGLFSKDGVTLEDIKKIDRKREPPEEGLMTDILWADPQPTPGRGPSKRGVGYSFGPDVTERFLRENNLDLLIRSHEVKEQGYEIEANGKLITVFSAPNYCDQVGNKGAFIRLKSDLKPQFTTYEAVPHPPVPIMAYASPLFGF